MIREDVRLFFFDRVGEVVVGNVDVFGCVPYLVQLTERAEGEVEHTRMDVARKVLKDVFVFAEGLNARKVRVVKEVRVVAVKSSGYSSEVFVILREPRVKFLFRSGAHRRAFCSGGTFARVRRG